jgi:hypothetical protein
VVVGDGAVIQLVTRCGSAEEFIERFARFTTATHVVVPALPSVTVGTASPFVIRLKDQTVMMQGRCEVTELRPVPIPPGGSSVPLPKALMSLRLVEMDAHSCGIHLRLMERHPAPQPSASPAPSTPASPPAPPAPPAPRRTPARSLSLVPPLAGTRPAGAEPRSPGPITIAPSSPAVSTMQVMSIPRPPPRPASVSGTLTAQATAARALVTAPAPALAAARSPAPAAVTASVAAPSPTIAPVIAPSPATFGATSWPETEATAADVVPPPPAETRVAGADFTLPANPLSDFDAAELSGFIDLVLLESTAAGVLGEPSGDLGFTPAPAPTPASTPAPALLRRPESRRDRAQRIARRWAPYAACVLAGVLLGIAFKPSSKPARPVAPSPTAAPDIAGAGAALPSPATAPAIDVRAPAPRDCTARVTTKPAGAVVFWGDLAIGSSPIEHAAVPCGTATVTFRRERFAEATETITTEPGHGAVVAERLYRPPAKLTVTATPAHALIKVNRRRVGPAPTKISTQRFEHLRVVASAPGYRPYRKTLYLKEPEAKLDIALVPVARPTAGRAAPPAAAASRAAPPPAAPRAAPPPAAPRAATPGAAPRAATPPPPAGAAGAAPARAR